MSALAPIWNQAKKEFEEKTKKKHPSDGWLNNWGKGAGIENPLTKFDGAKTKKDALEAYNTFTTALEKYDKFIVDHLLKDPEKHTETYKDECNTLRGHLKQIDEQARKHLKEIPGKFESGPIIKDIKPTVGLKYVKLADKYPTEVIINFEFSGESDSTRFEEILHLIGAVFEKKREELGHLALSADHDIGVALAKNDEHAAEQIKTRLEEVIKEEQKFIQHDVDDEVLKWAKSTMTKDKDFKWWGYKTKALFAWKAISFVKAAVAIPHTGPIGVYKAATAAFGAYKAWKVIVSTVDEAGEALNKSLEEMAAAWEKAKEDKASSVLVALWDTFHKEYLKTSEEKFDTYKNKVVGYEVSMRKLVDQLHIMLDEQVKYLKDPANKTGEFKGADHIHILVDQTIPGMFQRFKDLEGERDQFQQRLKSLEQAEPKLNYWGIRIHTYGGYAETVGKTIVSAVSEIKKFV